MSQASGNDPIEQDFIVVGAGSAGCALAYRLSENPRNRVLLIEAGPPDRYPFIHIPKGIAQVVEQPGLVWNYDAAPQAGSNRVERWRRGRTLGGSSSINGMVYMQGQAEDFDDWEALGNPGWGWRDMGAAFAAMETRELRGRISGSGPLRVSGFPRREPLCEALIDAAESLGVPRRDDLGAPVNEGVGYLMRSVADGRRSSAATAFLKPVRGRPNLRVVTGARTERVVFEGRRAVGVSCVTSDGSKVFRGREVILSAGALESPKLLLLSGIGPSADLQALGMEVVSDLPGVGRNMREHRLLTWQFRLKGAEGYNRALSGMRLWGTALQYVLFRKGLLADGLYDMGAFVRTDAGETRPDAQFLAGPFSFDTGSTRRYAIEGAPGFQSIAYPLRPESQGTVALGSNDPREPPVIVANYLDSDYDRCVSIRLFRFARAMFGAEPFARFVEAETAPGPAVETDDEIIAAFRERGAPGFHAAGTCKMGTDAMAVLDAQLRVRGVEGLRVADASIMPTLVSGNTNGPVMAIGWRAADLILGRG